jgi:hypothetical protein
MIRARGIHRTIWSGLDRLRGRLQAIPQAVGNLHEGLLPKEGQGGLVMGVMTRDVDECICTVCTINVHLDVYLRTS